MTTVIHQKDSATGDIYIGRPGKFGNPFKIGTHGDRAEVVRRFAEWVLGSDDMKAQWIRENVHTLKGKRLVCYCAPMLCHGNILAAMAEAFPVSGGSER